MEAWFPGAQGAEAIASVLFGETNPSGRLPISFPAAEADLPRPKVDGFDTLETDFTGVPPTPDARLSVDYDIEGSDVGYRWFARTGRKALFPFGYGLSYTTFASSGLVTDGTSASFSITNTGKRAGAAVGQVYLVSRNGAASRRLVAFQRVELAAGETRKVAVRFDPRLLADWTDKGWAIKAGQYGFALGDNAEQLGSPVAVSVKGKVWRD